MNTISSQSGGKAWVRCNNVYHINAGASVSSGAAILCGLGSSELYVECNEIIVTSAAANTVACCNMGRTGSAVTTSAILYVECFQATNNAIGVNHNAIVITNCDAACKAIFKGRYIVSDSGGANVSAINIISVGNLILDDATLIAIGTGDSITAATAKNATIYTARANKAVNGNVTQLVSTVLVDSNVI